MVLFHLLVSFDGSWVFPLLSSCLSLLYTSFNCQYRLSCLLPTYLLRLILLIFFLIFHYVLPAKLMCLPTTSSQLWLWLFLLGILFVQMSYEISFFEHVIQILIVCEILPVCHECHIGKRKVFLFSPCSWQTMLLYCDWADNKA